MLIADRNIKLGNQQVKRVYLNNSVIWNTLWTPSEISTIFWYDAADLPTITATGNQVTQMLDKSGNGWTVAPLTAGKVGPDTGTRTLNGLNVLEFSKTVVSPTNQILENNSFNQPQPFSVATVIRFDTDALADQDFLVSGTETSNPRISIRRRSNNSLEILTQTGLVGTPQTITEGNDYIALFRFNTTSSTIRVNGSLSATGTIPNNSFDSLNIGGNFSEDQSLNGFIAELVAFSSVTDQEIIEGYLAWKWGLVANLPAGHPYKTAAPRT